MRLQQDKAIVCLEGIVGSGKSTQIGMLYSRFSSRFYLVPELNDISPMKELREELTTSGRITRLSREDSLRLAQARGTIHKRALKESDKPLMLMDRGIYTGVVFERGPYSIHEMETISEDAGAIVPDLCFVLHCSPLLALQRIDERRIRVGKYTQRAFHETREYIQKTRDDYFEIAAHNNSMLLIDSSGTKDEVHRKLLREMHHAGIL